MQHILGRPVSEALASLPENAKHPRLTETAAPARDGQARQEGTVRVVACRGDEWIVARFADRQPRETEEA